MCENLAFAHHGDLAVVTLVEGMVAKHHSPAVTKYELHQKLNNVL